MSVKFKGGSFREVKLGYSRILFGTANIPKDAIVIGVRQEIVQQTVQEYVIYYEEIKGDE